MPPSRRRQDGLLARVNFPLYTLQMLTNRHVLVAGGGGSSKTGVANGFEIFEISHNGRNFIAEEVIRHETGPSVVMNCAAFSDKKHTYLVAGQESHCQLYSVKISLVDITKSQSQKNHRTSDDGASHLRKRTFSQNDTHADEHTDHKDSQNSFPKPTKRIWFTIKPEDSVQTDYAKDEPCQRVVRISHNGSYIATGGTDGHVRVWTFPTMKLKVDIDGHTKELDDIDFSLVEDQLISIAKDGEAIIWDYQGKKIRNLKWDQPNGTKYLYKRCRYGKVESDKSKNVLFMLANPMGRAGKQKGFLQMWDPHRGNLIKMAGMDESISALAVRDDGRFVAIGTMFSGSVSIYIAFSLQRALHIPNAHSMFVTGLEFLPSSPDSVITSKSEAAVLSISVDNRVCIHSVPYRKTMPMWIAILLIIVVLLLTFLLCGYLGL